jgi:hypothetical protein
MSKPGNCLPLKLIRVSPRRYRRLAQRAYLVRRAEHLANIAIEIESTMNERRSQARVLDIDLVMISWEENSSTYKQLGNTEDLSPDGISVVVEYNLAVGSSVTISYGEGQLNGIVRHGSPCAEGYFMGIEFTEDSKNSTLHFQPELLIPGTPRRCRNPAPWL